MRVLVLGGTGYLGPHVVRRLVEARHDVTVFHRGESQARLPEVRHVHGDLDGFDEHVDALRSWEPEVVL